MSSTKRKTIVYIDGFNLFHALKEMHWKKYYWLDLACFSLKILSPMQTLVVVKYFTSRSINDPQGQKRQNTYIEALETLADRVVIQYGKFTSDDWGCSVCGKLMKVHHEKQTDVNISVSLLTDAQEDRFDDAILITADSDQMGTVKYVTDTYPTKRVIVAFPPGRSSTDLVPVASNVCHLGQKEFRESQFPNEVMSKTGYPLIRPHSWV